MKERLRPTGVVNTNNNVSGNKGLRLGKRYTVLKGKGAKYHYVGPWSNPKLEEV